MSDYDDSDVMMSDESDFFDEDSDDEIPAAPKAKAAPKRSILGDNNAQPPDNEKSVEDQYQKLTQIEHILVRPDTYST